MTRSANARANARSAGGYAAANMPVNSVLPAISGTTTVGQTLTCSTGTWSKSPTLAYQWLRDGVPILGATANTRVLAAGDAGALMSCTVIATKGGAQAVATSLPTAAIAAS
jgi:hypothetical protein